MKRKAGGGYVDDVRELAKMPVRLHTCWRTKETVALMQREKRRRESLGGHVDAAVFPWLTGRCVAKTHLALSIENDDKLTLCSPSFSFHLLMSHMSPGELPASRREDLTELFHRAHPSWKNLL